ncbi:cysteine hydrolase family protein [Vulgatibacter sp.]|uniref:cysteine hydrolase family protein n=1 Tax=Vulgatibacter sp. TaxID=1971226 RepID=UPI003566897C
MRLHTIVAALLLTTSCAGTAPGPTLRQRYGLQQPQALDPARTALVLVDWQEEFFSGGLVLPPSQSLPALAQARRLLQGARQAGLQVIHVEDVVDAGAPLFAAGSTGARIRPELAPLPGEGVVTKRMAGGFSRSDLHEKLQALGVRTVVVSGLMTHLAVDTTVRDALVLGYEVLLPGDASATRDLPGTMGAPAIEAAALHRATLAALADRFASVASTDEVLALFARAAAAP